MQAETEVQVGRPARWMDKVGLGLAAGLIAVVWLLVGLGIRADYGRATDTALQADATLARTLAAEVGGRLRNIDTVLRFGGLLHARDPAAFAIPDWIGTAPDAGITDAALIDPDGILRRPGGAPADLRDRPQIAAILADPAADRLEIGPPLPGRVAGQRSIEIARPLHDEAGALIGIIMVTVDSDSFSRLYRRLDLKAGVVGLVGLDGIVRARVPGPASLLGLRLPDAQLAAIRSGRTEAQWRDASVVDGVDRFFTFRRVEGYPLAVTIGTDAEAALASPRQERLERLAVGGGATLLILAVCLAQARVRRRDRRARAQLEAVVAHVGQGIMMIGPDRRLAVVNRRATEMLGLPPGLAVPGASIEAVVAWQEANGEFGGGPAPLTHIDSFGGPDRPPVVTRRTRPDGTELEIRTAHAVDGSHVRTFTDVTEARRSAAAIADARDRALAAEAALAAALENVPHGVMLIGADNRLQLCNRAAIDLAGIDPALARPGTPIADLIAAQVAAGEIPPVEGPIPEAWTAMRVEAEDGRVYRRVKPDGRVLEVRSNFLADGRFIRTYTDITAADAALRAEAAARGQAEAAQAALAAAFENVPHGVLLIGADRRLQVINRVAAALIGLPPELARPGTDMRDLLRFQLDRGDFAGAPDVAASARASLGESEAPLVDYERETPAGRVVEARTTRLEDGRIIRTFTDVTERHAALAAQQAARAALAAAFENAPLGIALVDADDRIEVVNSLTNRLLDLPPDLLRPGALVRDILQVQLDRGDFAAAPALVPLATASLGAGPEGRATEHPPYVRAMPDGRMLEVRVGLLGDGRSVRTFTDVTARHAMLQAQEAALRSRTEFLAIVSHELRTPLNAVIGLSDLLLQHEPRPDQVPDLRTVRESGRQLLGLVDDILDVSRLERGRVTLREAAFDPGETLRAMAGLIAPRALAKGLGFALELDPALPRAALGDEERLRQVLLKLLDNAVKFTPSGRITLGAVARPDAAGGERLAITIADTGIGIAPEDEARLFEPFVQGDSSTGRRFGGLGLGLAVCRLLLESMGGSIAVESAAGSGSVFRVELPLRRPAP